MNKNKLYILSLELREFLNNGNTAEVELKIEQANLAQEELDFVFMCLHSNGYDPKTDMFLLCKSDNSAFLKLVNIVQSKASVKK